MKITGIRAHIVGLPADEPLAGAAENPSGTRPIVPVEVETDDGAVGLGVTFFGGALTGSLQARGRGTGRAAASARTRCGSRRSPRNCARRPARPGRAASSTSRSRRSISRCGIARQGAGPAAVETARRRARPGPDLCQRGADARAHARPRRARPRPRSRSSGLREMKTQLALPARRRPPRRSSECAGCARRSGPTSN